MPPSTEYFNSGIDVRTAGGSDVDDAAQRVAAIEHAVCAAQHFDIADTVVGELREIESTADGVYGYAVDQDFVEVRFSAANEERCGAAALAGLHDLRARNESQIFEDIESC